jgi:hypothetical protein
MLLRTFYKHQYTGQHDDLLVLERECAGRIGYSHLGRQFNLEVFLHRPKWGNDAPGVSGLRVCPKHLLAAPTDPLTQLFGPCQQYRQWQSKRT